MKSIIVPALIVAGILGFTWYSGSTTTAYVVAGAAVLVGIAYAFFSRRQGKRLLSEALEAAKPEYERILAKAKIEKIPTNIGLKGSLEWMTVAFDFRDKRELEFAIAAFDKAEALATEARGETHFYAFSARTQARLIREQLAAAVKPAPEAKK